MNVLLVDDERLNLDNLEYITDLVLPNAKKTSFSKGSAALEFIKENRVDLAFLDIEMRGISGLTLAQELRSLNRKANIVFCTGFKEYSMDAWDIDCSGYLLKPITEEKIRHIMDNLRYPIVEPKRVAFHCFGNFEVFCDGEPISFKYNRTKELLAYLVDRNGASCSMKELAAILFEDDQHRSYLYQIRLDLVNTLEAYGVDDMLNQARGYLGICKDKVDCDYYDFLNGEFKPTVKEYMTQYSFGELTLATLFKKEK